MESYYKALKKAKTKTKQNKQTKKSQVLPQDPPPTTAATVLHGQYGLCSHADFPSCCQWKVTPFSHLEC